MTGRRLTALAVTFGLLASPLAGTAQPPAKVPRIGYLIVSPLAEPASAERQAFLEGLRELGYEEGRNIHIEYRAANWNRELLPDLAEELVSLKVDVIVAVPGTVDVARQATRTIPIVVPAMTDPVELGLVASLARPAGNLTGPAWNSQELAGKRLELFKEAVPKASRVGVIWEPSSDFSKAEFAATQAAARLLRVTIEPLEVRGPKDFPGVLSAMTRRRPDALITFLSPLTSAYRPIILEFAAKNRIPTMFTRREDVEAGGLIAYAPHIPHFFRRAATYVDRILKGAKPGDLPIEQPTNFELAINLKTAKALGLKIPPSILVRANKLIE